MRNRSSAPAGAGRAVCALTLSAQGIAETSLRARRQLVAMADALDLRVAPDAPARLLSCPRPRRWVMVHRTTPWLRTNCAPRPPAAAPAAPGVHAARLPWRRLAETSAGIRDITNAMVDEGFKLNDVLRMILETMFRALGAQRMVFCLRDAETDMLTGRFGLGEEQRCGRACHGGAAQDPGDLFAAVCLRGADTLIEDAPAAHAGACPRGTAAAWTLPTFCCCLCR